MLDSLININQDHSTCQEPDINIELYSSGFFDGVCGLDATLPHFWAASYTYPSLGKISVITALTNSHRAKFFCYLLAIVANT